MCTKACNDDACDCITNALKISELCHLTSCSNQPDEEDDIQVDLDEEDVVFDLSLLSVSVAFSTYYLSMRNTYHSGPEHRVPSLILL